MEKRYFVKLYHSKDLHDLVGENEETYCLFVRDCINPLCSFWTWVLSPERAREFCQENNLQLNHLN